MHYEGVTIIMKKRLVKSLIERKPVNSRIFKVRLRGRHNNMNIIQCYAPTSDGDEENKNIFYEQLQAELEEIPRHDVIIVMDDMHAKIGDDNLGVEMTMGGHGCGTINNKGERLVDFCADNSMVIAEISSRTSQPTNLHGSHLTGVIIARLITSRSTAHGGAPH